jgi:hypothetical protein
MVKISKIIKVTYKNWLLLKKLEFDKDIWVLINVKIYFRYDFFFLLEQADMTPQADKDCSPSHFFVCLSKHYVNTKIKTIHCYYSIYR